MRRARSAVPHRAAALWLLAAGALALVGCGTTPVPQYRVDPGSYAFFGYHLGNRSGVEVIIEDIRYVSPRAGTMAADIVLWNRSDRPIEVDLGLTELVLADREVLAQEARAVKIAPGQHARASLSFRTDQPPDGIERGSLKLRGVRLSSDRKVEFQASFHRASEAELARERGEREDD